MFRFLTEPLDRWVMGAAAASLPAGSEEHCAEQALAFMQQQHFLTGHVEAPPDFSFFTSLEFRFASAVATPWPENNTVYGRFYRAGPAWRDRPSIVLLHGWNGELGYYWQFPWLAWRLVRAGINVAMLELPYHARRRPQQNGATQNFISHNLHRMAEATHQATSDIRAVMAWLREQASPSVGLWGISLGAWLGGLVCCHEPATRFAVLMSPVVRMDRAVEELPFCAPVRRSLEQAEVSLETFNLVSHRPVAGLKNILIIESKFDLFANAETIEELWRAWGKPEIWRLRHGHISILVSPRVMERTVCWVATHSGLT
ncbi:MAG TPA: alpha/beta hydrolase family protein [Candidatus Saccharimonadales bacterium]|nr:alpha/beta hydrolase family protein [Candidatus Saccharimonadales bacterium]